MVEENTRKYTHTHTHTHTRELQLRKNHLLLRKISKTKVNITSAIKSHLF